MGGDTLSLATNSAQTVQFQSQVAILGWGYERTLNAWLPGIQSDLRAIPAKWVESVTT